MGERAETFNAAQVAVLEQVATGASLSEILGSIVALIERHARGAAGARGVVCSILLFDGERGCLHSGVGPGLPGEFLRGLDGLVIGHDVGSCGAAAFRMEPVVVEDVASSPLWAQRPDLVTLLGDLRSCWSTPIISPTRELLGTFACYHREARGPSEAELALVAAATNLAAIAITHERAEQVLRQSERQARRLARLYAVASGVGEALARSGDRQQLFACACQIAVDKGLALLAWVGLVHGDASGRIALAASAGDDDGLVASILSQPRAPGTPVRPGPVARALRTGALAVSNDIAADPDFHFKAEALARGMRSCAVLPLQLGDGERGVFALYCDTVGAFGAEELQVLTRLASDLSLAAQSVRKDAALREQQVLLRENEALLALAGRVARLGGWSFDVASRTNRWSDEVCAIHGLPPGSSPTAAEAIEFYLPEFREAIRASSLECLRDGTAFDVEAQLVAATGRRLWVRVIGQPARAADGTITGTRGAIQDIDDRRKLEEQLRQAQKMEAIGQLAGGVAHDFNNMLSVILSYAALVLDQLPAEDPQRADIEEIRKAGERAASLTRQLLAFGRQQILTPRVVDVGHVVLGLESMLRRLLGEDIELAIVTPRSLGKVHADPGQLEQIVMNLAVNARDAMPRGGKLTIEVSNVTLDAWQTEGQPDVTAGPHVLLSISDTGTGMDAATRERIFEPFFTTKELGKGTGLGLSTVFGIVKQSHGHVAVESEPGRGATFKVFLPRTEQGSESLPSVPPVPATLRGSETILLVEDEEQVRAMTRTMLRRHGYTVLDAQNGGEALLVCEQFSGRIDLMLTDVVMPRMSGRELAERLATSRPHMRVLYVSGHDEPSVAHHGLVTPGIAFLQKPATPEALLRKVRELLEE